MHLYNFTIQKPTAVVTAIAGNFSSTKQQEIVIARGKTLELQRPNDAGKLVSLLQWECFGIIRSIAPFRLPGSTRDHIIIGSDSGRIDVVQYDDAKNKFVKIHEETFGRSGCRRIIPGQLLATDPRGRACMIAAVEKQKFVYVLNRDAQMNLTISSPLESHKAHTLCFSICGVDVGFENPIFAAIELDYEEADAYHSEPTALPPKMLTFYELDLGLNHMVRKWSEPVDASANLVIAVPGATDGPGGVLVCSEDYVSWRQMDQPEVRVALPRRMGAALARGQLVTAFATYRQKKSFFFLLQTEFGDLFKLTLIYEPQSDISAAGVVTDMKIRYLDSLPPAVSLCLTRTGLLYSASEFGAQYFFQIQSLGDDDAEPIETSASSPSEMLVCFDPRPLRNLALLDEIDSLAPLIDLKVADLCGENTPQIYAACGRGARSSLKILRQGLAVTEQAVTQLLAKPTGVWSVKRRRDDVHDAYIVVSFINSTIVLSIGQTVEEVSDSGLDDKKQTLLVALLGDDSLVQVHPEAVRYIRADKRVNEWQPPGKKKIVFAAANERQVVVALSGGELMYFTLDRSNQLLDVERKDMKSDIAAVALPPVPSGSLGAKFVAVGLMDNTVRLLSLDPNNETLKEVAMQACQAQPSSLAMTHMHTSASTDSTEGDVYLFIGLQSGVMSRSLVDSVEGKLQDTRKRYLGQNPVMLHAVQIRGHPAVMALSSRSWLSHTLQGAHVCSPLSYEALQCASSFASELVPEGIVSVAEDMLRIFSLDRLGEAFNQTSVALRYTPRKMLVDVRQRALVVVETDHNAYSVDELRAIHKELNGDVKNEPKDDMMTDSEAPHESPEELAAREAQEAFTGPMQGGAGKWASCIRIVDPLSASSVYALELTDNEAAFSAELCSFASNGEEIFLAVGTAKDLVLSPRSMSAAFIHIYRFVFGADGSRSLELIHKTEVDGVPMSLHAFQGQLLAGCGRHVRLFDMGKKKLLRKAELRAFPSGVQSLHSMGDRIYGGDLSDAFQFIKYRRSDRSLYTFAENSVPHFMTATCVVDYDTMAGGDKFGNIVVSRLPDDFAAGSEDVEDTSAASVSATVFNADTNKLIDICNFYVGETVTSIVKTGLMQGGVEVLLYSTIYGTIGALVPFADKADVEFFTSLEMHMRLHSPSLVGREHASFRSYYFPVKSVVDGDLCEQYSTLDHNKQQSIASDLVRTPNEVAKRLEDIRNRVW